MKRPHQLPIADIRIGKRHRRERRGRMTMRRPSLSKFNRVFDKLTAKPGF
jgi:hypothetical protein